MKPNKWCTSVPVLYEMRPRNSTTTHNSCSVKVVNETLNQGTLASDSGTALIRVLEFPHARMTSALVSSIIVFDSRRFNAMKLCSLGLIFVFAFAGFAQSSQGTQKQEPQRIDDPTLKKTVNLVNVFFTVKDSTGAAAFNLTKESFEVREDGRPQTVQSFAAPADQPLTLGVLVDTSGSMQGMLPAEKFAAADFLRRALSARDLAFLLSFDVNVELAQDLTGDVSMLRSALDKTHINIGSAQSMRGRTLLYDAVYLAANEVLNKEVCRKAMVIFTSGETYRTTGKLKQAVKTAQRADVTCYVLRRGRS